jgi:hypothetical protein
LFKVFIGQNITTGPPTYAMTRHILEGAALAKFEEATATRGTETNWKLLKTSSKNIPAQSAKQNRVIATRPRKGKEPLPTGLLVLPGIKTTKIQDFADFMVSNLLAILVPARSYLIKLTR